MTRRSAFVLATVSLALGVASLVALGHGSAVSHTTTLGTLAPVPATVGSPPASAPGSTAPPVPVPTMTATDAAVPDASVPAWLTIGRIGVGAPVVPTGVVPSTNQIEVPDLDHVGWYRFGPRPGEDGSAVLVGHVDGEGRTGIFWRLRQLVPGDLVTVTFSDGSKRRFVVSGRQELPKLALPPDLFSRQGPPRLTVITCGGAFNQASGHYLDNVIVEATPAA